MTAILLAAIAAAGFCGAGLLALLGEGLDYRGRSYSAAVAAGILLALAFVDLFPEALEMAGSAAVMGFAGGFALLFLAEVFTSAHAHDPIDGHEHKYALRSLILGLTIHNFADGFVLGISQSASLVTSGLLGLGILIHQAPVGVSLAAVLVAARASRSQVLWATLVPGLAIPLAAGLTLLLPVPGDQALGVLDGLAGGALAYIGAAHLLPEVRAGHPARGSGILFVVVFLAIAVGLTSVVGH